MTEARLDGTDYSDEQVARLDDADLPIHKAAYKGDIAQLSNLLPANVNSRSILDASTPLQLAIRGDHREAVQILLSAGADPELEDQLEACYCVSLNAINAAAWLGNQHALEALIDGGVQIPASALSWAASQNRVQCTRAIIEKLGSSDFSDMTRLEGVRSALEQAGHYWHLETIDFLLTQVEGFPKRDNKDDQRALCDALLFAASNSENDRCLWDDRAQVIIMQRLLAAGADVNPEQVGVERTSVWNLFESTAILSDVLRFLLKNGLRADGRFENARSPLFTIVADQREDPVFLEEVLSAGAKATVTDGGRATPLHYAVDLSFAELLHKYGADICAKDKNGKAPLHTACEHWRRDIVEFLLANGANVNVNETDAEKGWTPLLFALCSDSENWTSDPTNRTAFVEMLVSHGASVLTTAFDNRTALHGTARLADPQLAQYLIQHGVDVKAATSSGETPLHCLGDFGVYCDVSIAERCRIAHMLLDHGADIKARDENGATPLHAAWSCAHHAWGFSPELINTLLDRGADRFAKNGEGKTAVDLIDMERWMWNDEGRVVQNPEWKNVHVHSGRGREGMGIRGRGGMGTRGRGRGRGTW
ncbi:ankyrin repeat-containing domain protein [Paraphoma chrysanthemicola]|uniref:Ankyrin repeat-containing domain protein n=1 Tax=Paraphoma chrysanthemicola TaxID=798071 RepID=A0A8K0VYM0_9PLEO|nr:ankyrin repeat-containing domain protein [Paraphoma chrysanthemicola]